MKNLTSVSIKINDDLISASRRSKKYKNFVNEIQERYNINLKGKKIVSSEYSGYGISGRIVYRLTEQEKQICVKNDLCYY